MKVWQLIGGFYKGNGRRPDLVSGLCPMSGNKWHLLSWFWIYTCSSEIYKKEVRYIDKWQKYHNVKYCVLSK